MVNCKGFQLFRAPANIIQPRKRKFAEFEFRVKSALSAKCHEIWEFYAEVLKLPRTYEILGNDSREDFIVRSGKNCWLINTATSILWKIKSPEHIGSIIEIAATSSEPALRHDKRLGLYFLGGGSRDYVVLRELTGGGFTIWEYDEEKGDKLVQLDDTETFNMITRNTWLSSKKKKVAGAKHSLSPRLYSYRKISEPDTESLPSRAAQ